MNKPTLRVTPKVKPILRVTPKETYMKSVDMRNVAKSKALKKYG